MSSRFHALLRAAKPRGGSPRFNTTVRGRSIYSPKQKPSSPNGDTHIGGKSIFGNLINTIGGFIPGTKKYGPRKPRSNKGKKRGPRAGSKAYMKSTKNLFNVLPGSPRVRKGTRRFIGPLLANGTRRRTRASTKTMPGGWVRVSPRH
jgi:hypothetical protein